MPDDSPNGKTPKLNLPETLHFQRGPVQCRQCKRIFEHYVIEVIDDLTQLRCGSVLVSRAELVCMHCGWVFNWTIRERDLTRMAPTYSELIAKIGWYKPE